MRKLYEKILFDERKRNVDENLTPRKTVPYSLQIMIRKVNIPLTASQFKQRATLLRLIRFSHKDNFVLSVCKRNVTKTNSYFLSHICWRAFASQHTILSNSGKKSEVRSEAYAVNWFSYYPGYSPLCNEIT